jgi:hypothetical protein
MSDYTGRNSRPAAIAVRRHVQVLNRLIYSFSSTFCCSLVGSVQRGFPQKRRLRWWGVQRGRVQWWPSECIVFRHLFPRVPNLFHPFHLFHLFHLFHPFTTTVTTTVVLFMCGYSCLGHSCLGHVQNRVPNLFHPFHLFTHPFTTTVALFMCGYSCLGNLLIELCQLYSFGRRWGRTWSG